jgi:hypothetical protein
MIMISKGYIIKWSYPNLSGVVLNKTTKPLSQDGQSLGQDLDPAPPKYKEILPTT